MDSTTLLVSGENTRSPRAIYSSEKTKDMFGGTMLTIPESNRKTKMQDSNVLESSSSSHSLGSGGSSEKGLDVSAPGQKKRQATNEEAENGRIWYQEGVVSQQE